MMPTDDRIRIAGGFYVGCQIRIAEGPWQIGACKKPFEAMLSIDDDLCFVVCKEHLLLIGNRSVSRHGT